MDRYSIIKGREGKMSLKNHKIITYVALIFAWLLSVVLTLSLDPDRLTRKYDISESTLRFLQILYSVPNLIIWIVVGYTILIFKRYSKNIIDSKESIGFKYISYSFVIMLVGMIAAQFFNQLRELVGQNALPEYITSNGLNVTKNYVAVVIAVFTYWFLFKAAESLLSTIKSPLKNKEIILRIIIPLSIIGVIIGFLIANNDIRTTSLDPDVPATFGVSDNLIYITMLFPYIVSWIFGFSAILGFNRFRSKTKGIIYKNLFGRLSLGITIIIALTIILQILTQFSENLNNKGIGFILTANTIIYALIVAAFLVVANGAKRLNKIEEIT